MNDQDPKKSTSDFNAEQPVSLFKALFSKYGSYAWNLLLLSIGLYLVWTTISVLFNIIGCLIGIFLIVLALSEMKVFVFSSAIDFVMRVLRRR